MLDLLTNKFFWIALVVISIAALIIGSNKKYAWVKKGLAALLVLLLTLVAVYSAVNIYYYNSAKNNNEGNIDTPLGGNNVEVNELEFTIQNIELKEDGTGNHSAVLTIYENLVLDPSVNYGIYLNDSPCFNTSYAVDHIEAYFSYNFYSNDNEVILNDTLFIYLSINKNYSTLEITTQGGAEAVRLWNAYFGKNDCVLSVKAIEDLPNGNVDYGEGEVAFVVANYYAEGKLYLTQVYRPGDAVNFPTYDNMYFSGWATTEDGSVVPSYTITEDVNFYAKLDRVYTDSEFLNIALAEMQNGVLDLSAYPIFEIPAMGEPGAEYGYFEYNTSIFEVKFPTTLKSIGNKAFYGCTNLHTVSFTNGLESIGDQAFSTTNLKTVTIPGSVKELGINVFNNTALESVVIEEGVTYLSDGIFLSCTSLTTVDLPSSLQSIGEEAFKRCTALKSIYLPTSVTTMPSADNYLNLAFYGCSSDLVIYSGATEQPAGFGENWNAYNGSLNTLTVKWDYTEQDYLAEINGSGSVEEPEGGTTEEPEGGTTEEPDPDTHPGGGDVTPPEDDEEIPGKS